MQRRGRDSIDFAHTDIKSLFVKLFFPTFFGLLFTATLNIADGIFVGRGCGTDALAAVNIAAPIFLGVTGLSLLFGTGVSIVGAIHLAQKNIRACNINVTQAFIVSVLVMFIVSLTVFLGSEPLCFLFGGSELLLPLVKDYLTYISPLPVFMCVAIVGMFVIRLDGAPKYAMWANIVPSLLNIFLDWLFIFPLDMGLKGAAAATSLAESSAFLMVFYYMFFKRREIGFYHLKASKKSFLLTLRNIGYMMKVGFSTFIGETALCCMMIAGNYMFMLFLKEDGVAAYSVACYLFPLVFMFANSIFQTAMPIISYNYGIKSYARIFKTFYLSLKIAVASGIIMSAIIAFYADYVIGIFLASDTNAYRIGVEGLPYFCISFTFFSLNIVSIGYFQSLECAGRAIFFMLLRGMILIIPIFICLPFIIGVKGLWLAVPLTEVLTFIVIGYFLFAKRQMSPSVLLR